MIDEIKRNGRKYILNRICAGSLLAALLCTLSGCGSADYAMTYSVNPEVSSYDVIAFGAGDRVKPFASDFCVVTEDVLSSDDLNLDTSESAVLFDINNKEVIYSKNAHEKLHPASLTKIMTALVALKNSSLDQTLKATDSVKITESGAQLCGIKSGDSMTMDQALHAMLMYSANDAAMLIAENVGGTVDNFVEMMNEEAQRLGATNTHFVNPHGLTDQEHYTTAYDLYLIFNEAIQYEAFNEIIHMASYQTTYYDQNGRAKELSFKNTNGYINGNVSAPENVTVIGGKTGTTAAAGHCLILLSRDVNGAPYISVILRSESGDGLYAGMSDLLSEMNK